MKVSELISYLEEKYNPAYAESWDNVGLLVGDDQKEVKRVFAALDLTEDTLEQAEAFGADFVITHHPMIFSGIKKITKETFTGRRILRLLENQMAYYAIHTNFDVAKMAALSGKRIGIEDEEVLSVVAEEEGRTEGFGRVGNIKTPETLREYAAHIKEWYGVQEIKVFGNPEQLVKRAAVCTGAGKSFISTAIKAGADVYITGDIDHHTGIDAVAQGLAIIDAGHYGTEYIFTEQIKKDLLERFSNLEIQEEEKKWPYFII